MAVVDMCGKRFGRYTVLKRVENDKHGNAVWLCRCDCGNEKEVVGSTLRKGTVVSCGCYHKQDLRERLTTHNGSKSRLFHVWQKMKSRCYNKHHKHYMYYGGRGIFVCDDWRDNFAAFREWAMANGYSDNLTIDRIDANKGYAPDNCRWVSRKEQAENTRRVHMFTINGETKPLAEWCRVYGVPYERARRRAIDEKWDIAKALTTPALDRSRQPRKSL